MTSARRKAEEPDGDIVAKLLDEFVSAVKKAREINQTLKTLRDLGYTKVEVPEIEF